MTDRPHERTAHARKVDHPAPVKPDDEAALAARPETIPVMRPQLPRAEKLLPYLQRIDATRIYSNYGPLVQEFESRLSRHFGLPSGGAVSASTGTTALIGAVLATAGRARPGRPLALMPAFTFVATAVAIEQCGYSPYLADVDADTLMLDPERLLADGALDRIGVVVPVAPFGRAVPQAPWRAFRDRTGIPVVIDGAASFESVSETPERYAGAIPVMMSFHATKSFATGEGGCVISTDVNLATSAGEALNFGFHFSRDSRTASTNGKMSEYHAAVGLAELDDWDAKRSAFRAVADHYRRHLSRARLADRFLAAPDICSSYVLFRCASSAESERVQAGLRRSGVDFRFWYGVGLQQQTYFSNSQRGDLSVTEKLAPCLLGLPMAPDMTEATVAHIVSALTNSVERGR
jgi:dTDP-4-amino-4,6-dideoxygalactose transaminase